MAFESIREMADREIYRARRFEWNRAIDEASVVIEVLARQARAAGDDPGERILLNAADEVRALRRP